MLLGKARSISTPRLRQSDRGMRGCAISILKRARTTSAVKQTSVNGRRGVSDRLVRIDPVTRSARKANGPPRNDATRAGTILQ